MKVYTYYKPVPGIDDKHENKLIELWKSSWAKYGWVPKVLGERDAQKHTHFKEYVCTVSKYPTICPIGYNTACYVRWLAMEVVGGGFMCDYDCMNYGFLPPEAIPDGLVVYEPTPVPCLVSGTAKAFRQFSKIFQELNLQQFFKHVDKRNPQGYLNDMTILFLPQVESQLTKQNIVLDLSTPGYENAAVVHYSNHGRVTRGFKTKCAAIAVCEKVCLAAKQT